LRLLQALRKRGIDAASPQIKREIEALARLLPDHGAELLEALATDPYPHKDVRGKWGQHGLLRDFSDIKGDEEAWMWFSEGICRVIYIETDGGPLIIRVWLSGR
jgi:hypothetical protein